MKKAIIDTDILSFFFRNNPNVVEKLGKYLHQHGIVKISIITYYEVLSGLYFKDTKKQIKKFEEFVTHNEVLPMTEEIAEKAAKIYAELRRKGKVVGHNDLLIASTAIVNNLVLITNNTKHFKDISDLEIDNWAKKD